MERINTTNKEVDLFGAGKHGFRDGNPGGGIFATFLSAAWFNAAQEELCNLVEGAGIVLSGPDRTQVRQAVQKMIVDAQKLLVIPNVTFEASVADAEVVRWDSANNRFDEAVADGTVNQQGIGIADVTNGNVYVYGETPPIFSGLTPGAEYYLSDVTPGGLTAVKPANPVKVGVAKSATVLWVDVDAPSLQVMPAAAGVGRDIGALAFEATGCTITAAQLNLTDPAGNVLRASAVNVAPVLTVAGANGLDTGAEAPNTWYYGWVIGTAGGAIAGLISTSATAPVMPGGYTYKALVTAFRNDGSSNVVGFVQKGRSNYRSALVSALSSGTATVETAVSVANWVPPIAQEMVLIPDINLPQNGAAAAQIIMFIRWLSGNDAAYTRVGNTGSAGSSYSSGRASNWMLIPNVNQSFFYLLNSSTGSPTAFVEVAGFTMPIGGQ